MAVLLTCVSCNTLVRCPSGVPPQYLKDVGYSDSSRLNTIYLAGYRRGVIKGLEEVPRYAADGGICQTMSIVDFFSETKDEKAYEAGFLAGEQQAKAKVREVFNNVSFHFLNDPTLDTDKSAKPNQPVEAPR